MRTSRTVCPEEMRISAPIPSSTGPYDHLYGFSFVRWAVDESARMLASGCKNSIRHPIINSCTGKTSVAGTVGYRRQGREAPERRSSYSDLTRKWARRLLDQQDSVCPVQNGRSSP
jgi:hypothetical protein